MQIRREYRNILLCVCKFYKLLKFKKSGTATESSIIPKFNVNTDQRECKGEHTSRTKIASHRTHINTCAHA